MKHIDIATVLQDKTLLGSKVTVCGWVRTSRDSAAVAFLELTDGTSFSRLQVVVDKAKLALDGECTKCGASVAVTGVVVKAFKGEGSELNAESVTLLGKCPGDYPIQKKRTTLDFLLRRVPRAQRGGAGDPPLLPFAQVLLYAHAAHHGERLRGRGGDVPRDHAAVERAVRERGGIL